MHSFKVIALMLLLVSLVSSTMITQKWFLDAACSTGENDAQVQSGTCLLDSVDYSGVEWICSGSDVVALVFAEGDVNCTGASIAKKVFPPNTCVGPVYQNLYLIAGGC